mgnify:CR=1 FL=1
MRCFSVALRRVLAFWRVASSRVQEFVSARDAEGLRLKALVALDEHLSMYPALQVKHVADGESAPFCLNWQLRLPGVFVQTSQHQSRFSRMAIAVFSNAFSAEWPGKLLHPGKILWFWLRDCDDALGCHCGKIIRLAR